MKPPIERVKKEEIYLDREMNRDRERQREAEKGVVSLRDSERD